MAFNHHRRTPNCAPWLAPVALYLWLQGRVLRGQACILGGDLLSEMQKLCLLLSRCLQFHLQIWLVDFLSRLPISAESRSPSSWIHILEDVWLIINYTNGSYTIGIMSWNTSIMSLNKNQEICLEINMWKMQLIVNICIALICILILYVALLPFLIGSFHQVGMSFVIGVPCYVGKCTMYYHLLWLLINIIVISYSRHRDWFHSNLKNKWECPLIISNGTSTYMYVRTPWHKDCPNPMEWPKNVHS